MQDLSAQRRRLQHQPLVEVTYQRPLASSPEALARFLRIVVQLFIWVPAMPVFAFLLVFPGGAIGSPGWMSIAACAVALYPLAYVSDVLIEKARTQVPALLTGATVDPAQIMCVATGLYGGVIALGAEASWPLIALYVVLARLPTMLWAWFALRSERELGSEPED